MDTKVVNLFGPSGVGKSSGAAYIFSQLKMNGISCELVPEYAKDKVWENNEEIFKPENQVYIFGKQFYRISRLIDKVEYIITDSPILLSNVYNKSTVLKKHFEDAVRDCHNSLNNINYIITRVKPFDPNGRNEKTAEESDIYIPRILEELSKVGDLYDTISIPGDKKGYDAIVREIMSKRDN
jgi:deoxyadenosine/deoxycytidine kinase